MRGGEPLSWRHYVYGTAHLSRAYARDSLRTAGVRLATATGMGTTPKESAASWMRRMARAAGWD